MKIEYRNRRAAVSKARALASVNEVVQVARKKILSGLPKPQRKQFHFRMYKERMRLLALHGVVVPPEIDMRDQPSRRSFMQALPAELRVQIYKGVSEFAMNLAGEFGLPALADLEEMRNIQLKGIELTTNEEDANAIQQVTRDAAANCVAKHDEQRLADSGLSVRAARSDMPPQEVAKPRKA